MKYIIFRNYGTYFVAERTSSDTSVYGSVAECRSIGQAEVVKAALEAKEKSE